MQWIVTEYVDHLEVLELAVFAIGIDHVFVAVAEKSRGDAVVDKRRIVKITQHTICGGQLHGEVMIGPQPQGVLCFMTGLTGIAANECRGRAAK